MVPDDEGRLLPGVPDLAREVQDAADVHENLGVADDVGDGVWNGINVMKYDFVFFVI